MPASLRAGQIEKEKHPAAKQKGCVYRWPASGVLVTRVAAGTGTAPAEWLEVLSCKSGTARSWQGLTLHVTA